MGSEKKQGDQRKRGKGDGTQSIWLRPGRTPTRGEPPLTRARIGTAAVALLDEDGIDRLTMRRLADRLAVVAPSLYWHVDTKDDVIDLAVDAVFGETQPPAPGAADPAGGWREDVAAVLGGWRAVLLRHPWAAAVPARRKPGLGPHFLAWMEVLQATLVRAGFTGRDLLAATWALHNHVLGSASTQAALDVSAEERDLAQERVRAEADRYPTLAASDYLRDDDWNGTFAAGLDFILDGLQARLSGPPTRPVRG
ncbi:TetR/AcrR family transcriptional regulator C-terminal domain-containing protein [Streptomyces sp. WMMC500]|uniref:TetR/AcrR family transcriptional regulator C-terminal domain-containing protein n=1 Tax=Streptomyces sp. WMMC500 TaxID=3015154 RepID=UPI00248B8DE2|nr:TetR/AcrR family transcriptional regulator C-terminal domain-containing protein [Streptomyces sp. WMMC500]WBB64114.1 TetR/AcrR family transcriptional regulator C-terminal domain-containing protein [Streptomyces sp. WMMC500]